MLFRFRSCICCGDASEDYCNVHGPTKESEM
jgi:hypothetical protein